MTTNFIFASGDKDAMPLSIQDRRFSILEDNNMTMMNRLANVHNVYQGDAKRVLCVCSAGLLRSPTAAVVLAAEPFNFNTRAAGISSEFALIPVDQALLTWAEEIVCMEPFHMVILKGELKRYELNKPVLNLNIVDEFSYMNDELQEAIKNSYLACNNGD